MGSITFFCVGFGAVFFLHANPVCNDDGPGPTLAATCKGKLSPGMLGKYFHPGINDRQDGSLNSIV